MRIVLIAAIFGWMTSHWAIAQKIDFVRQVRPILQTHCYSCHGEERQKGGLRLDIKSEAFKGGDAYGPVVIAGQPADSPLIQFMGDEDDLQMPPAGDRVPPDQIALLKRWVEEGADWPDGADLAKLVDKLDHWSFKPIASPKVPATVDRDWPRHAIDHFVLAQLESVALRPAPPVDPARWLRRVALDLTGLPPTPAEVSTFLDQVQSSPSPEAAYANAVDRWLQSPRYGERWAQHWLDVVRYADTHGFEVNTERPHAWPYRDYVIAALNNDTPYDQFVREQIVGDAFEQDAATGFLVTASVLLPGQIGKDEPSKRLARQDSLDEIVVNIGQTFLGLSVGCARCHDHKFDPITQREYFAMQAIVAGVHYGDRELRSPENDRRRQSAQQLTQRLAELDLQLAKLTPLATPQASGPPQRPPVNPQLNSDRFTPVMAKRIRFSIDATNNLEPCIDELEVFDDAGRNVALATHGTTVTSSGDKVSTNRHELKFLNDGRYGNSRSWMASEMGKGWVVVEFAEEHRIDRVVWGRDREGKFADRLATGYRIDVASAQQPDHWQPVADASDRSEFLPDAKQPPAFSTVGLNASESALGATLVAERQSIEPQLQLVSETQQAFAGTFRTPDAIRLLSRGDPEQPKDEVVPGSLAALSTHSRLAPLSLSTDTPEHQRRMALATWITDPHNPLTARVMVNRIWQGHFGTGLVDTPSDLGRSGNPASHPELLDWLSQAFINGGWSIKQMHRMIVLSSTYRQSTRLNEIAATLDADNRLLWRYPSRRIDAETIRDMMLATSGQLNLTMGGPGFNLFDKRGGLTGFQPIETFAASGLRRLIYAHKVRREREAVFGAFDCPDGGQSTARRRESTTPIQALNLFNSRFTLDQSDALANRIRSDAGDNLTDQIVLIYQHTLNRAPQPDELQITIPIVDRYGLETLVRVIFNSNEFLFMP